MEYPKDFAESTVPTGTPVDNADAHRTASHESKANGTTSETLAELAKQNVAPFLTKYHPRQYAPLSSEDGTPSIPRAVNAGYCYRHQPDSKCNRQADEQSMRQLQQVSHIPSLRALDINQPPNTIRNWRPSLKMTNKASLMSGRSFPPPQPNSAS